jgi:hypothetical protein
MSFFFCIGCGIVIGLYCFSDSSCINFSYILDGLLLFILFLLGWEIALYPDIATHIFLFGWQAFIFNVGAVLGSILCVKILYWCNAER